MAKRRMFSLDIVDTDKFLELPPTTQALYFHLGMRCDDDGFVDSPKKIAKITGAGEVDLNLLCSQGYITRFEAGVIYINHFRKQNALKIDRYKPTIYIKEFGEISKLPHAILSQYGLLEEPGYVYVIQTSNKICKIGISIRPEFRISSIKTSEKATIINTYISGRCYNKSVIESLAHNKFKGKRIKGEWFNVDFCEAVKCVKDIFKKISIT